MQHIKEIQIQIEIARNQLFKMEEQLGLRDQQVIRKSKVLDDLINRYNRERLKRRKESDLPAKDADVLLQRRN
ncbi:aspartyl-phosphate phosphatase Spo0E family protein [Sporolactobacillus sp. THM7-7]|nr:aspartyl-phosphate phosphatase Spo0E family protein [Sporolactobacillus sp. THM7-7]